MNYEIRYTDTTLYVLEKVYCCLSHSKNGFQIERVLLEKNDHLAMIEIVY